MIVTSELTPLDDALDCLREATWTLDAEPVSLREACGRVLREPCIADVDMPPFDKSAMDGYACRRADLEAPLEVLECIQAGMTPQVPIRPGACSKIMTGAMIPAGADCVVPVEYVENHGPKSIRVTAYHGGANICPRGEDVRVGRQLLEAGCRLGAPHIGVLAAMGVTRPRVSRLPRVGIISTGSELVDPEETPPPGCIRNSNAAQLVAFLQALGIEADYYGIVPDDPDALRQQLEDALDAQDLLLSTGGVSVGDYDLMPEIIEGLGLAVQFRRLAIQPGKPVLFATGERKAIFALSGNPVSSFLQCLLLLRPFLAWIQGDTQFQPWHTAPLHAPFQRKRAERALWIPVSEDADGALHACAFHGSAHLAGLLPATAFAEIPVGRRTVEAGKRLRVCPISNERNHSMNPGLRQPNKES